MLWLLWQAKGSEPKRGGTWICFALVSPNLTSALAAIESVLFDVSRGIECSPKRRHGSCRRPQKQKGVLRNGGACLLVGIWQGRTKEN